MVQKHQYSSSFGGNCAEGRVGTSGERADSTGVHPVHPKRASGQDSLWQRGLQMRVTKTEHRRPRCAQPGSFHSLGKETWAPMVWQHCNASGVSRLAVPRQQRTNENTSREPAFSLDFAMRFHQKWESCCY